MLEGDPRSLARAITLVENDAPGASDLIRGIFARTGRAYLVGVTGPPGAGKSTLVDQLIATIRRGGQTVGVIAVDPSSPFTGGAVLGDRVRMSTHAQDAGVFIRSMATRGHLGGLSHATSDAALVLDAAGMDIVLIETVGVGQAEVDIVRTADISIVTLVPGTGDEVQALKAGVMEIGDIFVVNKADREGADRLVQSVMTSLALAETPEGAWRPPVLKTIATDGAGVADLWSAIGAFRAQAPETRAQRQRVRQEHRLREILTDRLMERVETAVTPSQFQHIVDDVAARRLDPYSAVAAIMEAAGIRQGAAIRNGVSSR